MSIVPEKLRRDIRELLDKFSQQTLTVFDINIKIPEVLRAVEAHSNNGYNQSAKEVQTERITKKPQRQTVPLKEISNNNAIINNVQIISIDKASYINEDEYDLVFNVVRSTLKFRANPAEHTSLKSANLKGVGSHRMQILFFMLKNSGKPFCCKNIYKYYSDQDECRGPNTYTKTIAALRKALEQKNTTGPYIVKQPDWGGITGLNRGHVYFINPEWKYLIISSQDNISSQFH